MKPIWFSSQYCFTAELLPIPLWPQMKGVILACRSMWMAFLMVEILAILLVLYSADIRSFHQGNPERLNTSYVSSSASMSSKRLKAMKTGSSLVSCDRSWMSSLMCP